MKLRGSDLAILLLVAIFFATSLSGCARLARKRTCRTAVACSTSAPIPRESLPTIDLENRQAIVLSEITNPIEGLPIAVPSELEANLPPVAPLKVRDLTLAELQRLAGKSAPIAQKLESHRDWLATFRRTPPVILDALAYQGVHQVSDPQSK
jgi:hypothetical protein